MVDFTSLYRRYTVLQKSEKSAIYVGCYTHIAQEFCRGLNKMNKRNDWYRLQSASLARLLENQARTHSLSTKIW